MKMLGFVQISSAVHPSYGFTSSAKWWLRSQPTHTQEWHRYFNPIWDRPTSNLKNPQCFHLPTTLTFHGQTLSRPEGRGWEDGSVDKTAHHAAPELGWCKNQTQRHTHSENPSAHQKGDRWEVETGDSQHASLACTAVNHKRPHPKRGGKREPTAEIVLWLPHICNRDTETHMQAHVSTHSHTQIFSKE